MKSASQYFAGITNDGMWLWTAGYLIGFTVGWFASFWVAVTITFAMGTVFLAYKGYSERKHGRRVNVSLPEATIVRLQKIED